MTRTIDEIKAYYDSIGLISTTYSIVSARDPNIPFSDFDVTHINSQLFKDGTEKIVYQKTERVSQKFQWVDEILSEWGYQLKEVKKTEYSEGYYYCHQDWKLNSFTFDYNRFHKDTFRIKGIFGYDNNWTSNLTTKDDLRNFIEKCIIWQIERSGDKQLMRQVKLEQLLKTQ